MAFALGGMVNEALNDRQQIDTATMDRDLFEYYYLAGRQMYSYISNNYEGHPEEYESWVNLATDCQRKVLPLLDPESARYKRNLGEYYFSIREYSKSKQVLSDLVRHITPVH